MSSVLLGAAAAVLLNPAVRPPHGHAIESSARRDGVEVDAMLKAP